MTWRALALAVGIHVLAGCGAEVPSAPATAPDVRAALEQRLVKRKLTFRWVVCVKTRRSFDGSPIFRCNVNFGAPHIVRYCATLEDGRLITNRQEPELRCGREVAG